MKMDRTPNIVVGTKSLATEKIAIVLMTGERLEPRRVLSDVRCKKGELELGDVVDGEEMFS